MNFYTQKAKNTVIYLTKLFQKVRPFIGILLILLTSLLFFTYLRNNPKSLESLKSAEPGVLLLALLLYSGILFTNFLITRLTVGICGKQIGWLETLQLTLVSTIANFFGPLQSGPGVRAIYLKQKYGIKLRDYTLASLAYYFFFALFSFYMLLLPKFGWITVSIFLIILGAFYGARKKFKGVGGIPLFFISTGAVTFLQVSLMAFLFFIELRLFGQVDATQAISYTGGANFALFVSLTPAAIGIREVFLLFSTEIHQVGRQVMLAASLLDRAIYLVFLGIIFATTSSLHLKQKFTSRMGI